MEKTCYEWLCELPLNYRGKALKNADKNVLSTNASSVANALGLVHTNNARLIDTVKIEWNE